MHPAHADVHGVQHHANGFMHQPPQAELRRHQVSLVPIRFPNNLQGTYAILCSQSLIGQSSLFAVWSPQCPSRPRRQERQLE